MLLGFPAAVAAKSDRLHGVVLAVTPADGEAIVRHDAFGSMPAMTMPFRIVPRSQVATLRIGTTIDATVDSRTEPWTLRDVRVGETENVGSNHPDAGVVPVGVGDMVPDVALLDQTGRPFRLAQLRGEDVVLGFIYTRCRDARMCPLESAKFHALQSRAGSRNLHLVEVSLDPSYDRPPVLARYGAAYGADPRRWTLAVGDAAPTLRFAARFGITTFPDPAAGLIHAENTIEIGPDGRVRREFPDMSWQPADILADIDGTRRASGMTGALPAAVPAVAAALAYLLVRVARALTGAPRRAPASSNADSGWRAPQPPRFP